MNCIINYMKGNSCKRCGARSFRADRALAGRLICSRCGMPAGAYISNTRQTRKLQSMNSINIYIFLDFTIIIDFNINSY